MDMGEISKNVKLLMKHFNNNSSLVIDYLLILHSVRDTSADSTADTIKAIHNVDVAEFLKHDTSKTINHFVKEL